MLIGLIMYISVFKAEIGSKLRPKSSLQPPIFTFQYGQSFLMYVIGFIVTEFVGILNVFLYIKLQQLGNDKGVKCFGYYSSTSTNVIKSLDSIKFQSINNEPFNFKKNTTQTMSTTLSSGLPCINGINKNHYYFEGSPLTPPPIPKCDLHNRNFAKSLNELYTEPAPIISPFDYPANNIQSQLKKSVSTLTDNSPTLPLISNTTNNFNLTIPDNKKNCKFSKENLKTLTSDMTCGLKKTTGTSTGSTSTLTDKSNNNNNNNVSIGVGSLKTGRTNQPKDIYFIEDNTDAKKHDVFIVDAMSRQMMMTDKKQHRPESTIIGSTIRKPNIFSSNKSLTDYIGNFQRPEFDFTNRNRHYDDHSENNQNIYHSRTLPRNFMKRSHDEGIDDNGRRVSASGLYVPLHRRDDDRHHYRKSCDGSLNNQHNYYSREFLQPPPKWPSIITRSPSSYSVRSQNHCYPLRNEFYMDDYLYHGGGAGSESSSLKNEVDLFDLDKIESERRKSHANLFDGTHYMENSSYDYCKSTAV